MKTLLPLVAAALLFVGCERIEGQLNVSSPTTLKNSDGNTRSIQAGTYTADIKANTKKKITLRLNDDNNNKFIFNIPDGSIPSNGTFAFKSSTVGQPVDLSGQVVTEVTNGERRTGYESCQYQEAVQVCYPAPQGGMQCTVQYQTRYGQRWIEYYNRTTNKNVVMSISPANTNTESAQFNGNARWAERVVLNQSMCR